MNILTHKYININFFKWNKDHNLNGEDLTEVSSQFRAAYLNSPKLTIGYDRLIRRFDQIVGNKRVENMNQEIGDESSDDDDDDDTQQSQSQASEIMTFPVIFEFPKEKCASMLLKFLQDDTVRLENAQILALADILFDKLISLQM
jgi:hypothetical protein